LLASRLQRHHKRPVFFCKKFATVTAAPHAFFIPDPTPALSFQGGMTKASIDPKTNTIEYHKQVIFFSANGLFVHAHKLQSRKYIFNDKSVMSGLFESQPAASE